ncbi:sensor histidine kinase [Nocardiopsis sp. NPDC055551]
MSDRRRLDEAITPDGVVLRHVRRSHYLTMMFVVVVPVVTLIAVFPGLLRALFLVALVGLFFLVRILTFDVLPWRPSPPYRAVITWTLVLVSLVATWFATEWVAVPWMWLLLPGTAIADVITLYRNRLGPYYALSVGLAAATCVYLVKAQGAGAGSGQQALLSFFVVMFIGYWEATGPMLWQRTVSAERATLRLAVAEERLRLSEDLHDILGRALEVVAFKGELAARLVEAKPERARTEMEEIQSVARGAVHDVRELVRNRRATHLPEEVRAAERLLRSASVRCEIEGDFDDVDERSSAVFGSVIRESVTNMLRHATPTTCLIRWSREGDHLELTVRNDGVPPANTSSEADEGSGIVGMRRRVAEHGGELIVEEHDGTFTLVARGSGTGLPPPGTRRHEDRERRPLYEEDDVGDHR